MFVCVGAEQPVHVADAGLGFPAVRSSTRGDSKQASLPHHTSHPTAGCTGTPGGKLNIKGQD